MNPSTEFDIWIYKVCERYSKLLNKEITDVYSSVNLTDAKLSFLDEIRPEDYKISS